jgi:PadR family transcriptional regulator, regulatory protein AphA
MSLEYAVLGFLSYQPMSGYDLKKYFDQSVAHFWSATQSHIYKTLETLQKDALVDVEIIPQEGKPNRKEFRITEAGLSRLHGWLRTPLPLESAREPWLIQVFFAHNLTNDEIVQLFTARMDSIRAVLDEYRTAAQSSIADNRRRIGIERLGDLWQATLDHGIDHYESELIWLEKMLPRLKDLPPMSMPKK